MADRRESRMSRIPAPVPPLQEKTNVALKRKAAEQAHEPAQPKRVAHPPKAANAASASTAPKAATAASASTAPKAEPAAGDKQAVEESFEDILARTGLSLDDILNKKLNFKKNAQVKEKLDETVPFIKQLRAAAWHLHSLKAKAELDSDQWQKHAEDLTEKFDQKNDEWKAEKAELHDQLMSAKAALADADTGRAALKVELDRALRLAAQHGEDLARLQAIEGELRAEAGRRETQLADSNAKARELEEVVQQAHKYSATLQTYNTSLQSDITAEKAKTCELQRGHDTLAGQVAHLGGMNKSLEQLLQFEKDQLTKIRGEAEVAARDLGQLRGDLDSARQERDRALQQAARLKEEVDRYKAVGGRSVEMLEELNHSKASLEAQLSTQAKLMEAMRSELAELKQERALEQGLSSSRVNQISTLQAQVKQLQAALKDAEERLHRSECVRRKLHNLVQELKGNVRVFCRVRPLSAAEIAQGGDEAALAVDFPAGGDALGKSVAVTVPSSSANQPPVRHAFAFDNVFVPGATQEDVFLEISELVQSALDGQKVCIFAYGQTGSGKTFTMLGSAEQQGVIPRAMTQVFESSRSLAAQGWSFTMAASLLEIYNEEIKDLLIKRKQADPKKHQIVHDGSGNTTVADLTLVDVTDSQRVESLLADAMEKRSVGCTALNEQSSRSHLVFTLRIDGVNSNTDQKVQGVLNLIDLAGSERVKDSGAVGTRLKEAQNINKSLSALGDVIAALAQKAEHIPFRNSKLTFLLQPCLGGDAKTLMFVNCAPSRDFANETLASLRFAAKVNSCEISTARKGGK